MTDGRQSPLTPFVLTLSICHWSQRNKPKQKIDFKLLQYEINMYFLGAIFQKVLLGLLFFLKC